MGQQVCSKVCSFFRFVGREPLRHADQETEMANVERKVSNNGSSNTGELQPGMRVYFTGLKNAAFLNGTLGCCQRWQDDKGRWLVSILEKHGTGEEKSAKPENLVPMTEVLKNPGSPVYVKGLTNASNLNGMLCSCQYFDAGSDRWVVQINTGEEKRMKSENLTPMGIALQPGACVYLQGLKGADHLNGLLGTCQHVNAGRVVVTLADTDEEKALKIENLMPLCVALQFGSVVHLRGLKVPSLNGVRATCESMDWNTGEWTVRLDDGSEEKVKPANISVS